MQSEVIPTAFEFLIKLITDNEELLHKLHKETKGDLQIASKNEDKKAEIGAIKSTGKNSQW